MTERAIRDILGEAILPSEIRKRRGALIALVGPGGVGKTTLLETLLEGDDYNPVAIFDMKGNAFVLQDDPRLRIYTVSNYKQVKEKRELLKRYAGTPQFEPKTVVWDTVSTLQKLALTDAGLTPEFALRSDPRRLYGSVNLDMEVFFQEQDDLAAQTGINIIFTLWDDELRNSAGDITAYELNLTHGSAVAAHGLLNYIYYVVSDGGSYPPRLITGENLLYKTKNQAPRSSPLRDIPKTIYQPSLSTILDAFNGKPFPIERHAKRTREPANTNPNTKEGN